MKGMLRFCLGFFPGINKGGLARIRKTKVIGRGPQQLAWVFSASTSNEATGIDFWPYFSNSCWFWRWSICGLHFHGGEVNDGQVSLHMKKSSVGKKRETTQTMLDSLASFFSRSLPGNQTSLHHNVEREFILLNLISLNSLTFY